MSSAAERTIMIVVSEDFGELGHASYFLEMLENWNIVVVLPANRRAVADHLAGYATVTYRNVQECEQVYKDYNPHVVAFFSGYLMHTRELLGLWRQSAFLLRLKRLKTTVLTSDPMLGLPIKIVGARFYEPGDGTACFRIKIKNYAKSAYIALRLNLLRFCLKDAKHIYPMPCRDHKLHPHAMGYYVEKFFVGLQSQALFRADAVNNTHVFVLAGIDYKRLKVRKPGFVEELAEVMNALTEQGAQVYLVGPVEIEKELRIRAALHPRIVIHQCLSFNHYNELLDNCRCAYYWNCFSFSLFRRLLTGGPVVFLDRGHMLSMFPEMEDMGRDLLFGGHFPALASLKRLADPAYRVVQEQRSVRLSGFVAEHHEKHCERSLAVFLETLL